MTAHIHALSLVIRRSCRTEVKQYGAENRGVALESKASFSNGERFSIADHLACHFERSEESGVHIADHMVA